MLTHPLSRYGGWATLVAGIIGILATLSLFLFFAIEAPQGFDSAFRFGFLSDVLPIIAAPPALVVIAVLFQAQRKGAPQWSAVAALLGTTGVLILAATNILFVLGRITLEEQTQRYFISLVPMGLWHILVNTLARRDGFLPARLTWFGILVGVGQILSFVILYVLDGYNAMFSSNPAMIWANALSIISLVIGVFGYIVPPIWLVWLGRVLVREANRNESIHTTASFQG